MTAPEYIQLKAFARVDGAMLSVVWVVSFACYVMGLSNPLYGMAAIVLAMLTPFFVARRLKLFRDDALGGQISFMRAYAYAILSFFYAGILFAVAQYVYFAFIDSGYVVTMFGRMLESPEGQLMVEQYQLKDAVAESLSELKEMRPIDFVLNILTVNISMGLLLGLPIAGMMMKRRP